MRLHGIRQADIETEYNSFWKKFIYKLTAFGNNYYESIWMLYKFFRMC